MCPPAKRSRQGEKQDGIYDRHRQQYRRARWEPASAENTQPFATEKDLVKLAAGWPASRLAEIWNSFAGVAPFDELNRVKKFNQSRAAAVARIWAAVQRLSAPAAPVLSPHKKEIRQKIRSRP